MKAILGGIAIALGAFILPASAADKGSADEAIAMVKKAVAMVKADGKDKTFAAISDPANKDFHDRDLYVFVYDMNGVAVAHGNNPKMVGRNLMSMKDNEGKAMIQEMVDVAKGKGKGWVDYKWPNPATKTVDHKSSYVEKVDDILIGAGIYK